MNRGYIIPRLILLFLVWAFFYFAFDPLLKWGLIKGLQNIFEARVEIAKVKTKILNPSLEIYDFKAGNSSQEYKNLFEFSKLKFSLNGKQLLEKKFIIEEGSLAGLKFDTVRKTSCKIYIPKTEMPEFLKKYTQQGKEYSLERISDIKADFSQQLQVDEDSLASVKLIKEFEQKYQKEYKEALEKADFSPYQAKIDEISRKYEKIKSEKNFIKQAKEIGQIKKDIDELLKNYRKDRDTLSGLIKDSSEFYKGLNEARKQDTEKIMSMARIPSMDSEKTAEILLGDETYEKIRKYFSYSQKALKYIPENPKKNIFSQKAPRGRTIHFIKFENYPRFLLKKVSVDAVFSNENPVSCSGYIENVTNEPRLYQKPLIAEIKGAGEDSSLYLKFTAYLYKEKPETETAFYYKGAKIAGKAFGNENSFKINLEKAVCDTDFKLKTLSKQIDGVSETMFRNASLKAELKNIKYEPLKTAIENSISSINSFKTSVSIAGDISSPSIKIKTDLAEAINGSFKKAFGQEAEKARKKIEQAVDEKIKQNKDKLDKIVNDNKAKIQDKIKENEAKIKEWQKDIEEKLKKGAEKSLPKIKL